MRAIRLTAAGGPEQLSLDDLLVSQPGGADALVRVHAAAITRGELAWPVDRLPATPSYEASGVVEAVGPDATGVAAGDAIYALTGFERDGAAADFALVASSVLARKPASLDHVASAAIPMGGLTAWQALFDHGGLAAGERVLIHGAGGGVGHLAVQIAKWRGAHVIAPVAATDVERVAALGADEAFDREATPFAEATEPVDLVFDTVGGDRLARSPAVLREGGRIVTVAEEPPAGVEADYFVVEPNREQLVELAELADAGLLKPAVGAVFALEDARAAFERVEAPGSAGGKVVLEVGERG
jgi:NADPH:quinone reductase-like Zn-dependent oxidoreductase